MLINVLICGGRHLNAERVAQYLKWNLRPKLALHCRQPFVIRAIIEGEATGADTGARIYAERAGYHVEPYPIDKTDPRAKTGPLRNLKMILDGKPNLVVAFPGHSGTADMVTQATSYGIPIINIVGDFT